MSRAILKMLLARTVKHEPTDGELAEFLRHCRDLAGERIFVPQHEGMPAEQAERIKGLRSEGLSIRRIAKVEKLSKSQVHRALSQNSDLFRDSA
jgi:hypothetical protein